MKENDKITILTTTHEYSEEDYNEYCQENGLDVDLTKFIDWECKQNELDVESEFYELKLHGLTGNPNDIYLVEGHVGTWQGPRPGGIIDKIYNVVLALSETDDNIAITTDDNGTYIDSANHDACSHFNVWLITDKAKVYLQNLMDTNGDRLNKQDYHQVLLETEGFLKPVTREIVNGRW